MPSSPVVCAIPQITTHHLSTVHMCVGAPPTTLSPPQVYLHLRKEAHHRRCQRDLLQEACESISALQQSQQHVREAWATWNPQRAAARQLQQLDVAADGSTTKVGANVTVTIQTEAAWQQRAEAASP